MRILKIQLIFGIVRNSVEVIVNFRTGNNDICRLENICLLLYCLLVLTIYANGNSFC